MLDHVIVGHLEIGGIEKLEFKGVILGFLTGKCWCFVGRLVRESETEQGSSRVWGSTNEPRMVLIESKHETV